ncbi:hypothetical protein QBC33DRAFT_552779 [Phialemonium atrogriseum]|uniref:DNA polymerase kappa n=1 Tax=Phialemonium atrogriseum TaxID=1093897 RepID=A0AAJ0FB45_9PEZI|nr:uncharacterized protein QBC33DRAFT_552779 [Phialemonium atrogriseum]KAK1762086.1 hypothetical protein QBC33DRAFT_552779 [Phialemonium atrogriseum]
MAAFVARRLCPDLIVLPLNFDKYRAKAAEVRAVLARYDPRFESASIDEAYLNLTAHCAEHGLAPDETVRLLRAEIYASAGITVSAGIAANARLAKICSDINKPNGQYLLPSDRTAIMAFMRDLPCRKVNGVGRVLERELSALGIVTCGDVYVQRQFLGRLFGDKVYGFLLRCHLGLGRTSVQPAEEYGRKSVGTESTFRDMSDPALLRDKLRSTAVELEGDLHKAACKGRTLVLKVKLHTYEVFTRQAVPPKAVCLADDLYGYALPMLTKLEQEIPGMKLRLMGLRCTNLVSTKKPDTLAFFGLKPRRADSADGGDRRDSVSDKIKANDNPTEDGQWEQWPEEEVLGDYEADMEEHGEELRGGTGASPDTTTHAKEIPPKTKEPAPEEEEEEEEEEWWDCPVCSRPQAADERLFNEHIDLCLSRQTIRDAVQQHADLLSADGGDAAATPEGKRQRAGAGTGAEKKRGRPASGPDPRQKKLCFG